MEFTKTSHIATDARVTNPPQVQFEETEIRKNDQPPDYYFDRASKNRPIRSSIPVVVADAEKLARNAVSAAKRAERTNRIFVGAGILAIAGIVVGLFSLLIAVNSNVVATHNLIKNVSGQATQAQMRAENDIKDLRSQMEATDFRRLAEELQRIQTQLDDARAQIESLKSEVQRLQTNPDQP